MIVRFNKGPWHRKVRVLSDAEVSRGVIEVAVPSSKLQLYVTTTDIGTTTVYNHKIATYRIKMVTVNLRGKPEHIPSVFPDGAVCFELEGIR